MSEYTPDYEPKGIVKTNPISIMGMYITAVMLLLLGPFCCYRFEFEKEEYWAVILPCAGGAVLFALMAVISKKLIYYWDDEHITILQPFAKPVTYSFEELAFVHIDSQAVTLEFINRKRYILQQSDTGIEEFKAKLRETADNTL